jgi:5-methyltetrahydrofolate--homocysteine methyltransferase
VSVIPSVPSPPLLVGERINAQGSRRAKRLLLAADYDGLVELGRRQIAAGAHVLDVCVAMPERADEATLMADVVQRLSMQVDVPVMIDSTEPSVIARALAHLPRRAFVNSISLAGGRDRLDAIVPIARHHGAAIVALTIDEAGTAKTAARKLEIARRLYDIVVGEYGLRPDEVLIDPVTFTLGTGNAEWVDTARETIEGIRAIKRELPDVLTILGVSDVSFKLSPAARPILNSVFLHQCVEAGLDAAIVDPERIRPVGTIAREDRRLAEELLFNRAEDALPRFVAHFAY